jgi:hypothetical protein
MSKNIWIGIAVVVVLAAGGWWYFNQSTLPTVSDTTEQSTNQATQENTQVTTNAAVQTTSQQATKVDPELSASPISGTAPLDVSFSVNKQGLIDHGSDYSVDFGDGTQSSTAKFTCGLQFCSQQHPYDVAGTYTAKYVDTAGNVEKTFTIVVSVAPAVTYQTIHNLALNISFAVPSNWVVQNLNTQAEDPVSLGKISDGYGFGVSISTNAKDNTATTVYSSPVFSTLQSQADGYAVDTARLGCFDNTYAKIKNLTISGVPAVLFTASGGCDYENNYKTLWIHGQAQDWFVTFEDSTYPDKYPYEATIMQSILSSVQVTS